MVQYLPCFHGDKVGQKCGQSNIAWKRVAWNLVGLSAYIGWSEYIF